MFSNYLKVAFRILLRHKSFSAINILGLAIGMPVCLLLILVIDGQRNLDQFNVNKDRVFRITTRVTERTSGTVHDLATAPAPLGPLLKSEVDEIEEAVRLLGFSSAAKYNEKLMSVDGFYAEESFFRIFSFALRSGNPETALKSPFSAVISADFGRRFFGDQDPTGRVLTFSFVDVVVTGVLEDPSSDQQSHLDRELLISFSTLAAQENKPAISDPENWNKRAGSINTFFSALEVMHRWLNRRFPG